MSIKLTITNAGKAALVNPQNTGTLPITIARIALGSASYTPSPNQTALVNELKRITSFGGIAVAPDTLHVTIQDNSSDAYSLGEFGLITSTGVLFAVCSLADEAIMEKNTHGILLLSADIKFTDIDVSHIEFGGTNFLLPPASESEKGLIQIASEVEAAEGLNDEKALTPANSAPLFAQKQNVITAASEVLLGFPAGANEANDGSPVKVKMGEGFGIHSTANGFVLQYQERAYTPESILPVSAELTAYARRLYIANGDLGQRALVLDTLKTGESCSVLNTTTAGAYCAVGTYEDTPFFSTESAAPLPKDAGLTPGHWLILPKGTTTITRLDDGFYINSNRGFGALPGYAANTVIPIATDTTLDLYKTSCFLLCTGSASVLTIPPHSSVPWPIGAEIHIQQGGDNQITVAASAGVVINSEETNKTRKKHSVITIKNLATNVWTLFGSTEAAE